MRPRSAAIVACRVIAVVFGTQAITFGVTLLITAGRDLPGEVWVSPLTMLGIALLLWVGAEALSVGMARGTESDPGPSVPRPLANVYALGLSIVGVVLIAQAIPDLISVLAASRPELGSTSTLSSSRFASRGPAIAAALVQMAIGSVLIAGSRDMGRGLARRAPEPEPPSPAPPHA